MTTPKIMIGIPTHDGRIHLSGMYSILYTYCLMTNRGWDVRFDFSQSSDLVQSRGLIALRFMESDCTHLLMIDTDLDFDPEAPIKLIDSGHMLCGGVYPKKKLGDDPEFTIETLDNVSVNGFRKARYIGAGLMMVRRPVFEKIKQQFPALSYTRNGLTFTSYFQNGIYDDIYCSEDASFCLFWQKCGGTVWALEDCRFNHYGAFGWSGNFKEFLAHQEKKAKAA